MASNVMVELPPTPLQIVPESLAGRDTGPELFLKREDLLPFGGGSKVRRFLSWLKEQMDGDEGDRTHLRKRTVAVLSNQGAHTFQALTRIFEDSAFPIGSLLFWECATRQTPYSERVRRIYLNHPNISVCNGPSFELFLRFLWTRCFAPRDTAVIGVGGSIHTKGQPYRPGIEECLRQLDGLGKGERARNERVWHLFPVASGNMTDSFLRTLREERLKNHRVIGVLTAPLACLRLLARLKYLWRRNVVLVRRPRLSWQEYRVLATRFFNRTGVWLDPNHTVYAADLLYNLPSFIRHEDLIVFWITSPFIANGPDRDAGPLESEL